jgi:hypothetical protein
MPLSEGITIKPQANVAQVFRVCPKLQGSAHGGIGLFHLKPIGLF